MTKRFLAEAGISRGMRAIEIGCGGGEVTQLLAELVGPSGAVVAVDCNLEFLAIARKRMEEHQLNNVQFVPADVAGDLSELGSLRRESYDALAGRRVLMYLPDPAEVLRRLSAWLRRDALVVFEETDSTVIPARLEPRPGHDRALGWLRQMLVAERANTSMGFCLPATLDRAGLRFERVRAEAVIEGQGSQYPLAQLLRLMQARVVAAGIATESELTSLAAQLDEESRAPTSVYVSAMSFCAWARKP
ncbi:MAG: methyltransferase domain-containing protein [Myxococcales bacterium]